MTVVANAPKTPTPNSAQRILSNPGPTEVGSLDGSARSEALEDARRVSKIALPNSATLIANPSILISTVSTILNAATPSNKAALAAQLRTVLADIRKLSEGPPQEAKENPKIRRNIALLPRLKAPIKLAIGALEESTFQPNFQTTRDGVVTGISRHLTLPITAPEINPAIDGFGARDALKSLMDADPGLIFVQAKTYLQQSRDPRNAAAINTHAELGKALSTYANHILDGLKSGTAANGSRLEQIKTNRLFLDAQSLDGVGRKLSSREFSTRRAAITALEGLAKHSSIQFSIALERPRKPVMEPVRIACSIAVDPSNIATCAQHGNSLLFRSIVLDFLRRSNAFSPEAVARAMRDFLPAVNASLKASGNWAMSLGGRAARAAALPIIKNDIKRVEILAQGLESGRFTIAQAVSILDSETKIVPEGLFGKIGRLIKTRFGKRA